MDSNADGPSPRTLAGRYRLGPTIGTGATAKVFDAVDTTDNVPVVVKMLPAAFGASGGFMRRFNADVEAAGDLVHPNIARVKDFGIERQGGRAYPFVVTEQLAGGSLRGILDRGRQLSPSQALMIGLDVCRGLDFAHRRGLIHGAVTPSNLLFGIDRRVRIADFGLSRLLGEVAWADPGRVDVDVARYASPEQALGLELEPTGDVYSLVLSLIESVTGQVPFAADTTVATLVARVDKLMPVSADLGPLAAVLEKAGRPTVEGRATAAEFGRALVQAAEKMPRPAPIAIVGIGLFGDVTGSLPRMDLTGDRPLDLTATLARTAVDAPSPVVEAAPASPPVVEAPVGPLPPPQSARVFVPNVPPPIAEPLSAITVKPTAFQSPDSETSSSGPSLLADAGLPVIVPAIAPDIAPDIAPEDVALADIAPPFDPGLPLIVRFDDPVAGNEGTASAVRPPHENPPRRSTAKVETVEGDDDAPNFDRRSMLSYVLVALGLVIAAVIGIVGYRALSTPSYAVPNLIGVPEAEAVNQVAANGWTLAPQRQRDDAHAEGDVIRTEPSAGEKLKKGATLVMVVSEGPTLATLPEIAGLPIDQARTVLELVGLAVREADRAFDEAIPPGHVVFWSVPAQAGLTAGGEVPKGTTIEVVVSAGPSPRQVPNLLGLTVQQARDKLAESSLALGTVTEEFNAQVPAGQVISSAPAAGGSVTRATAVSVVVSKGLDSVSVPRLLGLNQAAMETALLDAGLLVGSTSGPLDGVVAGTDRAAGSLVPRGTKINVIFGTA